MQALTEILTPGLAYGSVIALLSGLIQGYTGFGGGLIIVPGLAFLFGPIEAVAIAVTAGIAGNLGLLHNATRTAHWPEAWPVVIAIIVSVPIGLMFLVTADPVLIRRGMGLFVLLAAFLLMSGWTYNWGRGVFAGGAIGALSGLIFGAFGIPGGPIFVVYFLAAPHSVAVQRANIVLGVSVTVLVMLIWLIFEGIYNGPTMARCAVIAPLFLVGVMAGKRLFEVSPAAWFQRITYGLLLVSGFSALLL